MPEAHVGAGPILQRRALRAGAQHPQGPAESREGVDHDVHTLVILEAGDHQEVIAVLGRWSEASASEAARPPWRPDRNSA